MTDAVDVDAGYDDLLDAIRAGEGYYLACPEGHGSLPPRRVCPVCGEADLSAAPLPAEGSVHTYTVVHVPAPQFEGKAPYVTAIAEFGPVRLTGLVVDADPEDVAVGSTVTPDVEAAEEYRRITFDLAE